MPNPLDNQPPLLHRTFMHAFLSTLGAAFKDKGVVLMLVIAPIIYGFFYPWPYHSEVVFNVPVGIVDNDHSRLSKTIGRYSDASPRLKIHYYQNQAEAMQAMYQNDIAGFMVIPAGLEKKVYAGKATHVSVLGNNSYFLINKYVQTGFTQAVATVSAGVEIKRSVAQGAYINTAKTSTQAIPLRIDPLFNRTEGYGAYVVPAVALLILQQTLLMGTALLIGTWHEKKQQNATAFGWLGRILALASISFLVGCFYYGWVFTIQGYARGHNLPGTLLFFGLYALTVATLGCVLGMWFRERERSMQLLIFSSLPVFFVSGIPWPTSQLPLPLYYLSAVFPSTAGMNASVQLNQMGASLSQVSGYLTHLAILWVTFFILLLIVQHVQIQRYRSRSINDSSQ